MKSNFEFRTEQRQHIALSQYAYNTITNDSLIFFGKENISGMINRIFQNYYQDSKASIHLNIQKRQEHFKELFKRLHNPDIDSVIKLLNKDFCRELQENLLLHEKDISLKIRLNNTVYDLLYPNPENTNCWSEAPYFKNQGLYLKAVIEDYARLTLFERERIFYKEFVDTIQNELDHQTDKKRILQLDYTSVDNQLMHFNVKPYAMIGDKEKNYNYLVGFSGKTDTNGEYKPGSFRLSRIVSVHPHGASFGSGKITKEGERKLLEEINNKGVQFLLQRQEEITVRLTEKGKKMFKTQLSLRPIPIREKTKELENGGIELHFYATQSQIQFYFFKFGKEAHIISPQHLVDAFVKQYKEAYESYT